MPICPHCNMPLSIKEGAAANCAACGNPLPQPQTARVGDGSRDICRARFAVQAGHYSVLAPLVMFCLSSLLVRMLKDQPDALTASVEFGILTLIVVSGLALGIVGIWLGIRHRRVWAITCSAIGTLINAGILGGWIYVVVTGLNGH
jgi:hypothetical protein